MHHHLSEVGFDLAAGPVSLAYGGRVDHVPRRLAKGETLNKRISQPTLCLLLKDGAQIEIQQQNKNGFGHRYAMALVESISC